MSLLQKDDLQYDYAWKAIEGDDPDLTGPPDSALLNRHEGYEVLPFINRFAKLHGFKQKLSGVKTEWLIQKHLPSDVRSHQNVRAWLAQNWKSFDDEWNSMVSRGDVPL